MSLSRGCCRLRPSAPIFRHKPSTSIQIPFLTRAYADAPSSTKDAPKESLATKNPVLADYLKKNPQTTKRRNPAEERAPDQGTLASNSLFASVDRTSRHISRMPDGTIVERNINTMRAQIDPQPAQRRRWERKMVIKAIRRRGRLSRTQVIKRTEREHLSKSEFWKTSVKKLNPLARQIAGKPIEEAIVQMNFSKKKAAVDIYNHLVDARDRAIVERGMGLGHAENRTGKKVTITLRDGSKHKVEDRTGIYVEQAWVGKGPYGMDTLKRARGRMDRLRLPQTSISVLLKEEHTRVREFEERKKREDNKKAWQPLPDRPITSQRPYYAW